MQKAKRQTILRALFLAFFLLGSLAVGCAFLYQSTYTAFHDEIISTLGEVSGQSALALRRQINSTEQSLEDLASLIGQRETADEVATLMDELVYITNNSHYKRMGVILPDGATYTTDREKLDLSDRPYFKASLAGETVVSETLVDRAGGDFINVYSTPIKQGGKVQGVLFATVDNTVYQKTLDVSSFGGMGYSYIVQGNGDAVVGSDAPTSFAGFQNIFTALEHIDTGNAPLAKQMKADMEKGGSGHIKYRYHVNKYMYYTPVGVNDWYLLTVVPTSVLNEKMNFVMLRFLFFSGVVLALTLALVLYIFHMRTQSRKKLEEIAFVDPLTGGPTLAKFREDVAGKLRRSGHPPYAMMSMDVDQFKFINDLFGFEEGNHAICTMWGALSGFLEKEELLCHKEADRFLLLLNDSGRETLSQRLGVLCTGLEKALTRQKRYAVSLSMGVYQIPAETHLDVDSIIDRAEIPRYWAKKEPGVSFAFYDAAMRERILEEKAMEDRMASAIKEEEFKVYYQPQYRAADGKLVGAEALVRWQTERGCISPGRFIPLFERDGFITKLDEYVFTRVCKDLRAWLDAGLPVVPVSVNLSRLHLYDEDFVEHYAAIVALYRLPPHLVELELTESAFSANTHRLIAILEQWRSLGFRILMDDFGTGYSSLNLLQEIPVDVLKLDKGIIDGAVDNPKGERIMASIIELAQSLGMEVIAEGVETEKQYEQLRGQGCDVIQGFYFAKPMPEGDFTAKLQKLPPSETKAKESD